jgi:hypothetical protein
MAVLKDTPPVVIAPQPATTPPTFQQQAFGPWSMNDIRTQRTIVRTNATSGITQRRFTATAPAPPTIAETRTALAGGAGFEFAFNAVTGSTVSGYNVYSSTTNNSAVAKLIHFLPQPPITVPLQSIKFQDVTSASPFYWVSTVNSVGQESARVPIAGNAAPIPSPTQPTTSGGASGSGAGGGAVGGGGRYPRSVI